MSTTTDGRTLYDVLGAHRGMSDAELRRAHLRAARAAHPDYGGTAEDMAAVNSAWSVLGDARQREAYDWSLDHPTPEPEPAPYTPPPTPPPEPEPFPEFVPRAQPVRRPIRTGARLPTWSTITGTATMIFWLAAIGGMAWTWGQTGVWIGASHWAPGGWVAGAVLGLWLTVCVAAGRSCLSKLGILAGLLVGASCLDPPIPSVESLKTGGIAVGALVLAALILKARFLGDGDAPPSAG